MKVGEIVNVVGMAEDDCSDTIRVLVKLMGAVALSDCKISIRSGSIPLPDRLLQTGNYWAKN
jgi:hypothetical protein